MVGRDALERKLFGAFFFGTIKSCPKKAAPERPFLGVCPLNLTGIQRTAHDRANRCRLRLVTCILHSSEDWLSARHPFWAAHRHWRSRRIGERAANLTPRHSDLNLTTERISKHGAEKIEVRGEDGALGSIYLL